MRPYGNANRSFAGRSWELRLFLNHTKAVGTAASATFATNLGTGAKQVFGTSTTFTKFSWTSVTSISGVNPPAWTIPFTSSFIYIPTLGNLCWEWRHKNASVISTIPMDATSAGSMRGTAGAPVGTGCTGSSTALTFAGSSAVGYNLKLDLTGAAANANALIAIGLKQQNVDLGWCGNVLLVPTILLPTKTAGNGSITLSVPHTAMQGLAQTDILFQFAWDDKAVKGGVGLSNLRPYKSPAMPGAHTVARIYKASFGSTTNGDELATTGSVGNRYGLIVGWLQ